MGYEVIPVDITKYVMSAKEIARFFNKWKKWYTYATRIPLPGEMIRVNGETRVISDGCANYIRDNYTCKEFYKLKVIKSINSIIIIIQLQLQKVSASKENLNFF